VSLSDYFEQHEEQAFIVKALATAVTITLVKELLPGLVCFLYLILPVVFLLVIRFHAAASGVDANELLREHITFLPMIRSEDERRSEIKPWVTYSLILANVLIFYFIETNIPSEVISDNLVFLPHKPDLFNVPLSALTSLFLHANNGHLWGNMTFLWVVGAAVERRVGRLRFLWLYLATGLLGGLLFILVEFLFHARAGHALGASGAIAGIMGVFAVRCYFKTMVFPIPIFALILPISLKVRLNSLVIMALFFLSDLSGGMKQLTGEGSMIGHWAHLGGMITGMLIAGYLKLGDDAVEERHLEIGIKASQAAVGFEGGERSMQIALDRNPDNLEALLGMARLKTKFHGTPEGKELYEKALALMLVERPAEVAEVFREYFGKFLKVPSEHRLLSGLAQAMGKAGETQMQISCLQHLVEIPEVAASQRERALYQLAKLLEFTSCFEAARSSFARFACEYPDSILADKARELAGGEVYRPPQVSAAQADSSGRVCPGCGRTMMIRRPTSGAQQGVPFWVCGAYPTCRTVHPVEEATKVAEPGWEPRTSIPERYRLVFDGTIGFTCDPDETKENLVRLFRCSREQVERLCSGRPTVLKRGLDHAAALKYKEAISRTGALCTIENEEVPAASVPQGASQPLQPRQQVTAGAPAPESRSFSCPKCGQQQEKGESCVACGVFFAKAAKLAERELQGFQEHRQPEPGGWKRRLVEMFSTKRAKVVAVASLLAVISSYFIIDHTRDLLHESSAETKLASAALKTQFDIGKPDSSGIKTLLAAHDFRAIESLYQSYLDLYQKDISYEAFLLQAYEIFAPENKVSQEDLDLWVATTGSYIAYAARGEYKARQGFVARGGDYISNTPQSRLDEMHRLHDEAAKDLQTAVAANRHLMPAYIRLVSIAKTSNMPFSAKEIVKEAERIDPRSFYVRHEYMGALLPRWGGSYGEMSDFAKTAIKYCNLNPRLWSLQGAADADRADLYYREGDYSAAARYFTKALSFGDRVAWLKYRAACYENQGKSNEAAADYRKAQYYDPDSAAQAGDSRQP